ncbi:MAG: large subunit ribosomal protein L24 [Candidatus Omnitrophota bacterium]|jgi:large subunit ribosomal protein L24
MSLRVKRNDQIIVLAGKSKGKTGKVLRLSPDNDRAFVEGVNLVKRFVRRSQQNPQGGVVEREASIHISNLSLIDPKSSKGTRFKIQSHKDGSKIRTSIKSGLEIGS